MEVFLKDSIPAQIQQAEDHGICAHSLAIRNDQTVSTFMSTVGQKTLDSPLELRSGALESHNCFLV